MDGAFLLPTSRSGPTICCSPAETAGKTAGFPPAGGWTFYCY